MENIAGKGSFLVLVSCVTALIATILQGIAFGTDYWIVSDGRSPFVRMGFHHACWDQCYFPYCPAGDQFIYDGCWWIYNLYFREIEEWLIPNWYLETRNIAIANVPVTAMCFFVSLGAVLVIGIWRYPREKSFCRELLVQLLLVLTMLLTFTAATLCLVVMGKFYLNAFTYDWMPMPEKNHLGYSYWCEVSSCVMLMISFTTAFIALFLKTMHLRNPEDPKISEDMMLGQQGSRMVYK